MLIWNMRHDTTGLDLRELFSFDKLRESGRVKVVTTEEFLETEAYTGNLGIMPGKLAEGIGTPDNVVIDTKAVTSYLVAVGGQHEHGVPTMRIGKSAFVWPRRLGERVNLEDEAYAFAKEWLHERELLEYRGAWEEAKVIHWRPKQARLLAPFYTLVFHADEASDHYHKRLMRDMMHYPEEVYCKASQIISLLKQEDPSGEFSTFHVRRNDFQRAFKNQFMNVSTVIENSVDHLNDNELVYVATDEKDLSVFDPFKKYTRVRFLSDYYERAGVSELSPNLIGMLEQIIASHGRTFTGCWMSTFTAYILRLRGYLHMSRTSSFMYYKPKKTYHHTHKLPEGAPWVTEWPFGWEGIDGTRPPDPMVP